MAQSDAGQEKFFQFSLLGLVTSGYLAVAGSGHLDLPTTVLTAIGLLLRALMLAGRLRIELSDRQVTVLTILYFGFYPLDYRYITKDFLIATVHLVFFLAILRILTARSTRDDLYTAAISLIELLAAALISIQWNFFLFLGMYVLFAIATLMSAEIRRAGRQAQQVARTRSRQRLAPRLAIFSGAIAAGVLFLTALLFFLLPRTANAALRQLVSKGLFLPGFSNQIALGQMGEVKTDPTPVMRVRFMAPAQRFDARWRGSALSVFDGRRWYNTTDDSQLLPLGPSGAANLMDPMQQRRQGRRISYRVDLKPLDTDVVFFAGLPEMISINALGLRRSSSGTFRVAYTESAALQYLVHAFIPDSTPLPVEPEPQIPADVGREYMAVPPLDPRIPVLAAKVTEGIRRFDERARAIEKHLRTAYRYTLELPSRESADPLAQFLFERKEGHCEYFASAMAVMLRTQGIPARMVTGFLGGTLNPISGQYVIRASDAHTWVEAWLPGRGWSEFDPTPPDPNPRGATLWTKLGMYIDAADTFWQEWVVTYDLGRQLLLAERMQSSSRSLRFPRWASQNTAPFDWAALKQWLWQYAWAVMAAVVLLGAFWKWGPPLVRSVLIRHKLRSLARGEASANDATVLYRRFLEILAARGYTKPVWLTPLEFAGTLKTPDLQCTARQFTAAYHELRFGGKLDAAPQLTRLLEQLERGE
jgi:hypothetical protein